MITRTVTPDADTLFAALERLPQDEPVVMLNLLQFREQVLYADGGGQGSGRDAYRRYGELVFPMLEKMGASVVFAARAKGMLIAPEEEHWDDVLLVRYPSVATFKQMIFDPVYLEASQHRTAALLDSRLIAMVQ